MTDRPLRWGVLGAAVIARKFWQAVRLSDCSTITAIAARDAERAQQFIADCQSRFPVVAPPQVLRDYQQVVESPDVDAIYIPLPTGLRLPWVLEAAQHGKHVLCEKPCAVSNADMLAMVTACQQAGVQFMDNVMFMHSQRMQKLRDLLSDPQNVGSVQRVATQFSFLGDDSFFSGNIRNQTNLEPWGCLGDLGWYCIRACLLAMGDELPVAVRGRLLSSETGAGPPVEFSGELFFAGGRSASLYCSFRNQNQQWLHVSGTGGNLWIDDFVLPWFGNRLSIRQRRPSFNESGYDFNYECHGQDWWVDEYGNGHPTAQEVRLIRRFVECSRAPEAYWPEISRRTQTIMQALWDSAQSDRDITLVE